MIIQPRRAWWQLRLAAALLAVMASIGFASALAGASGPDTADTAAAHVAPSVSWPLANWSVSAGAGGFIAESSPTVASWRNETIVAVGAENGDVYVLNAATGHELPGWPQRMYSPRGQPVTIESSPTIAWLNGPKQPPSVIVGTGSTWIDAQTNYGEVEAFTIHGKQRWHFAVGHIAGTAEGVISSPAVGNVVSPTGPPDIVFGSWDHNIYVLNRRGQQVGVAYNSADTVWSSPTLYRLPGRKTDDVFVGSDASGRLGCVGGFIGDYRFENGAGGPGLRPVWRQCENQTIWSSPAIGMLDGRLTLVVGTGYYEQPFPSDTGWIYALDAVNGHELWRAPTAGPTVGSPAIGTINASDEPAVVSTSFVCNGPHLSDCFAGNISKVYAWSGSGTQLWSQVLRGPTDLSSPVLVPLLHSEMNDVLVGSPNGLYPLDGTDGAYLYGTNESNQFAAINPGCRVFNAVAVADVAGNGSGSGWHVFEACGGPAQFGQIGRISSFVLPVQPRTSAAWPMFRGSPEHDGVAYSTLPGPPVVVPGISPVTSTTTTTLPG